MARFNQALALNALYHLFGFHRLKSRRWAVVKTPLSLPAKIAGTPLICPSFNNNLRTAGQHGALSCFSLKQGEKMSVSMTATRAVYTLRYILKYMINNRCHLPNTVSLIQYQTWQIAFGCGAQHIDTAHTWNQQRPVCERSVIREELITHLTSFRIHKTSLFSDSHIITDHC